ncbi:MAG: ABC transporter ATP-binding protein [Firmicutes bacterium]|nr:ABC transporter ATP-binding protein [Bacillota bacterium]
MEQNNVAIQFKHVSKKYKLYKNEKERFMAVFSKKIKPKMKVAINDVSFTINKGDSVALFGKNGAGKSTMLKMITGVLYPSEGDIVVNGRVSALLELSAGFDPDFTGRENIYFKGQLLGIDEKEIAKLESAIVDFADIGEYIDQPVRSYSSGMKARLGFAINVNIEPEILIVDEALSVGDKAFRQKCNLKIKEVLADGQVTFLFVTHSTKTAKNFCERGIVMKQGCMLFDGEVNEAADFYEKTIEEEIAKMGKGTGKKKGTKKKKKAVAKPAAEAPAEAVSEAPAAVSEAPVAETPVVAEVAATETLAVTEIVEKQ